MLEGVVSARVLGAPAEAEAPPKPRVARPSWPHWQRRSARPAPFWTGAHPVSLCRTLSTHWFLLRQLAWREVRSRYEGSLLGLAWAGLQPLLMLMVYVFVFRFIFRAPWSTAVEETQLGFVLSLLAGLLTFGLGSELLQRSPGLVLAHANLVKRVRFPLEVLSPVALLGASFQPAIGLVLVSMAYAVHVGSLHWQVLWLPAVLLPYLAFLLGCSWLLATLGTFLRDLGQVVAVGCQLLMFLTPVFYPLAAVPERFRWLVAWSPFAIAVENVRLVLLQGRPPDWPGLLVLAVIGLCGMHLGHATFLRAKRGFADVT
jgi:lipopolysaccharide transport system permease protein